jgi:hypothetical protein
MGLFEKHGLWIAAMFLLTLAGCGASENGGGAAANTPSVTESARLTVGFDYQSQRGAASNQFAVWIEDADGELVKTLYATAFTANGGYEIRPDSILNWVAKSGLPDMPKAQVDAITGATPKSGKLAYVWDLTDGDGDAVPDGDYAFVVEGTLRMKNFVLFEGDIAVGGDRAIVNAEPAYHFEADDEFRYDALTEDSTEIGMIGNVTAEYVPAD